MKERKGVSVVVGRCIAILGILSILAGLCGCLRQEKAKTVPEKKIYVATIQVGLKDVAKVRILPARIRSRRRVVVSSKISGNVVSIAGPEGRRVKGGEVILRMDDRELRGRIDALSQEREAAKKERRALWARKEYAWRHFQRYESLFKDGAVTREEYEQAKSRYLAMDGQEAAAKAKIRALSSQMEELQALLTYALVRAPTDGIVVKKYADQGSFVTAGRPVLELESPKAGYWVEVHPDESLISSVSKDEVMPIEVPALARRFHGTVDSVDRSVDPKTRTFLVKMVVKGPRLRDGMFASVFWPLGSQRQLLVPSRVLVHRGDLSSVYVVDGQKRVHLRIVRIGRFFTLGEGIYEPVSSSLAKAEGRNPEELWVEVLSGLVPGERVVNSDLDRVSEGMVIQ